MAWQFCVTNIQSLIFSFFDVLCRIGSITNSYNDAHYKSYGGCWINMYEVLSFICDTLRLSRLACLDPDISPG